MTGGRYVDGVPCWIATTPPSLRFASELLGWELDGDVARLRGRAVAGVSDRPGWTTYVRAGDIAERVGEAGGSVVGERLYADPQGAVFATIADTGPQAELVNAPGAWNWSNLRTPEPVEAASFYGAVFGWEVDPSGMTRLPGYADVLERHEPGIRRRHADFGAVEGFTDAVAWIVGGDGPARWEVVLAVADADAAVSRVRELGGEVLEEPHDVPPTRLAVVRDPAGATFTVSAFHP